MRANDKRKSIVAIQTDYFNNKAANHNFSAADNLSAIKNSTHFGSNSNLMNFRKPITDNETIDEAEYGAANKRTKFLASTIFNDQKYGRIIWDNFVL